MIPNKLQFSGHESFVCKHLWLKKGFDYIKDNNFSQEDSVVELGVGKNMVNSILFWMRSYGLLESNNKPTQLATYLFGGRGVDKYLEDLGSIWLLHYSLITTNKASVYNIFFNHFRKGRVDFTKDQFLNYIKRMLDSEKLKGFNINTIAADISVFLRSYLKPQFKETKIDIEEDYSSLMIDLEMMSSYKAESAEGKLVDWYKVENKLQIDLPIEILLYAILDNSKYGKSVSFKDLLTGLNSPGVIFALNEEGLIIKLEAIVSKYKQITFTESAGVREIQFRKSIEKFEVLNGYYKG